MIARKSTTGTKSIARSTAPLATKSAPSPNKTRSTAVTIGKINLTASTDKRRIVPNPPTLSDRTMRYKVHQMPGTRVVPGSKNVPLSTKKWQSTFHTTQTTPRTNATSGTRPANKLGAYGINVVHQRHAQVLPEPAPRFPQLLAANPIPSPSMGFLTAKPAAASQPNKPDGQQSIASKRSPQAPTPANSTTKQISKDTATTSLILSRAYSLDEIRPLCQSAHEQGIFDSALKLLLRHGGQSDNKVLNRIAQMCSTHYDDTKKSVLPFLNYPVSGLGQPELVNVDGFSMINTMFSNIQKHPFDKHVFFFASIRTILSTETNEMDTWAKLLDLTMASRTSVSTMQQQQ